MEPRLGTASTSSHNCNGSMRKEQQVGGKNLKPHSTPATLLWLEENYEMAEGVCVPRNTLYLHYVDFCAKHSMQPVNAASFGKIIRQQFPQLTTRRLGTRGQSRYHYYGIAIRETSAYYELIYSKKGIQATGDLRKDQIRQVSNRLVDRITGYWDTKNQFFPLFYSVLSKQFKFRQVWHYIAYIMVPSYAPRGKMATRLPEFPSLRDLCLPAHVPEDRVATFIMMYRAHCQRLLDTVIRASFDEVQTFLLHFWQGMPPHLIGILGTNVVVNIVGVCDSILYRSVCSILMPSIVRTLPEALIQVIRKFATELDSWLRAAMEDLPENLRTVKSDLARHFCHMLRRQASLNQVMQASRLALHDSQLTVILLHDWRHLDLQQNVRSALQAAAGAFIEDYSFPNVTSSPQAPPEILMVTTPNQPPQSQPANKRNSLGSSERFSNMEFIGGLCGEFERLLQEQVPIEAFTEWLETVVERCVVQSAQRKRLSLRQAAKTFLAAWIALSARLLRDLSLHSAPSFGSFNLLRLMADDYLLYLVELLHMDERARELMRNISMDAAPEFVDSDYETLVARMYSITDDNASDVLHDMNVGDVTSHSSPAHSYTLLAGDPSESSHHPATQHSSSTGGCLGNDMDPDASQTSVMGEYVHITDSTTASHCNAYSYDGDTRGLGNGYKFSGGYMYVSNGQPQTIPYSLAVLGPQPEISNAEYTMAYPGAQYGAFRRDFADPNTANYYPEAATYPVSLAVHGSPEYYASYDVTTYETANNPRPKSVPGEVKLGDSEDRELTPSNTYLSSNSNSSADTPYLRS